MDKRQLIDEIRTFNPTAQTKFLNQFDEAALRDYLENLKGAACKKVRLMLWAGRETRARLAS